MNTTIQNQKNRLWSSISRTAGNTPNLPGRPGTSKNPAPGGLGRSHGQVGIGKYLRMSQRQSFNKSAVQRSGQIDVRQSLKESMNMRSDEVLYSGDLGDTQQYGALQKPTCSLLSASIQDIQKQFYQSVNLKKVTPKSNIAHYMNNPSLSQSLSRPTSNPRNMEDHLRAALNNSDIVSIMSSKRVEPARILKKADNLRATLNGSKVVAKNRTQRVMSSKSGTAKKIINDYVAKRKGSPGNAYKLLQELGTPSASATRQHIKVTRNHQRSQSAISNKSRINTKQITTNVTPDMREH